MLGRDESKIQIVGDLELRRAIRGSRAVSREHVKIVRGVQIAGKVAFGVHENNLIASLIGLCIASRSWPGPIPGAYAPENLKALL